MNKIRVIYYALKLYFIIWWYAREHGLTFAEIEKEVMQALELDVFTFYVDDGSYKERYILCKKYFKDEFFNENPTVKALVFKRKLKKILK